MELPESVEMGEGTAGPVLLPVGVPDAKAEAVGANGRVALPMSNMVDVGEDESSEQAVNVAEELAERVELTESVEKSVGVAVPLPMPVGVQLAMSESVGEGGRVADAVAKVLRVSVTVAPAPLSQALPLPVPAIVADSVDVAVWQPVLEQVPKAMAVAQEQSLTEGVWEGLALALAQGAQLPEALQLPVGVSMMECEGKVEPVPQAEGLGPRECEPLGEQPPDALLLLEALAEAQVVGEPEAEPMLLAQAQWLLVGQEEALGLGEAEGLEDREPLGERMPLAQPLALVLALVLAEAHAVGLGCMVGEELQQAEAVTEAQGEDQYVALGEELPLEVSGGEVEAEGDREQLALVLGVGMAQAVGLSEGGRVVLALAVVLEQVVKDKEDIVKAVLLAEGLGMREGKPLGVPLPEVPRLYEALGLHVELLLPEVAAEA